LKIRLLIPIAFTLIFVINTIPYSSAEKINLNDDSSKVDILSNMLPGDIILIRQPRYVGTFLGLTYWTHTYIYIGNNQLIDSNGPNGVSYSTVDDFRDYPDYNNYVILRVKENPDLTGVFAFLEDKIGYPYDYSSIFFPKKEINASKGEFGYGYTCTELIWAAYMGGAKINLDNNNRGWITPWELYNSKHLEVIYTQHPDDVHLNWLEIIFNFITSR